jgi:succinate dehydrogenase/fumarate reductase cytochrome b subunit
MNPTLLRALVTFVPVLMLVSGSSIFFSQRKTLPSLLQLLGAGCLLVVVLTHLCEGLHLIPSMYWGQPRSLGHYLDLSGAVLGLTLFPVGYLLGAVVKRQP